MPTAFKPERYFLTQLNRPYSIIMHFLNTILYIDRRSQNSFYRQADQGLLIVCLLHAIDSARLQLYLGLLHLRVLRSCRFVLLLNIACSLLSVEERRMNVLFLGLWVCYSCVSVLAFHCRVLHWVSLSHCIVRSDWNQFLWRLYLPVAFLASDSKACHLGRQLVTWAQLINWMLDLFFCWGALWLFAGWWPICWLGAFLLRDLEYIALINPFMTNPFMTLSPLFDWFLIILVHVGWISLIVFRIGFVCN